MGCVDDEEDKKRNGKSFSFCRWKSEIELDFALNEKLILHCLRLLEAWWEICCSEELSLVQFN